MMSKAIRAGALLACLLFPSAARAEPRPILNANNTTGASWRHGNLAVLGVERREVLISTVPRATFEMPAYETLHMPPHTQFAVPVLSGWRLGYGDEPTRTRRAPNDDHHWGSGTVDVAVDRFDPPREVRIRVMARLSDRNSDDRWWATISYYVIFFGDFPPAPTGPTPQ